MFLNIKEIVYQQAYLFMHNLCFFVKYLVIICVYYVMGKETQ